MGLRDQILNLGRKILAPRADSTRADAFLGGSATSPTRPAGTITGGGWANPFTGMGFAATDATASTTFVSAPVLSAPQAWGLYEGDGLAARVAYLPAQEALRQGWEVTWPGDETSGEDVARWAAELVTGPEGRRGLTSALHRALLYRAVFGGAALVLVCADGRPTSAPLDTRNPGLKEVRVLARHDLQSTSVTTDPATGQMRAGSDLWQILGGGGVYHRSRLLFLGRSDLPSSVPDMRQGWEASVYERLYRRLAACGTVDRSAEAILAQFVTPVQRMKGLAEALAQGGDGLLERMGFEQMTRSLYRVTLLDAEHESYENQTTSVAGLAELMDRFPERVSAATGIPMTLLMGHAPSGLSTDDQSGRRFFYDSIAANEQNLLLRPLLQNLLALAFATPWGPTKGATPADWRLDFRPLYQLTEAEQEAVALTRAQRDAVYLGAGVLRVEEVRRARFAGNEGDVTITEGTLQAPEATAITP